MKCSMLLFFIQCHRCGKEWKNIVHVCHRQTKTDGWKKRQACAGKSRNIKDCPFTCRVTNITTPDKLSQTRQRSGFTCFCFCGRKPCFLHFFHLEQVRFVSVQAERPYHPSHDNARQGGSASQGRGSAVGGGLLLSRRACKTTFCRIFEDAILNNHNSLFLLGDTSQNPTENLDTKLRRIPFSQIYNCFQIQSAPTFQWSGVLIVISGSKARPNNQQTKFCFPEDTRNKTDLYKTELMMPLLPSYIFYYFLNFEDNWTLRKKRQTWRDVMMQLFTFHAKYANKLDWHAFVAEIARQVCI